MVSMTANVPTAVPTTMTLEYVMRTGRVRYEDFRRNNPEMMRAYEELR